MSICLAIVRVPTLLCPFAVSIAFAFLALANSRVASAEDYEVWVYKLVDNNWVRQDDRTLRTSNFAQGKEYAASVNGTEGWSATSNLPEEEWMGTAGKRAGELKELLERGHRDMDDHPDDALRAAAKALEINPRSVDAHVIRGGARMQKGEWDATIDDTNEAIRLQISTKSLIYKSNDEKDATAYLVRAMAWLGKKEFAKAVDDCNDSIRLEPKYDRAFSIRGIARLSEDKYELALRDADEAIHLNAKYVQFRLDRANILCCLKRFGDAADECKRAIELDPKQAEDYHELAIALRGAGQERAKSIACYSKAIELDPKNSDYYVDRANLYDDDGQFESALDDYGKAIQLDPNNAIAYRERGTARENRREHEKAIADFTESIRISPEVADTYEKRSLAWSGLGEYRRARADLEECLRLDNGSAEQLNNLAWLLATCAVAEIRNGDLAIREATKACELNKWKKWNNLGTLAAAYAEAGIFETAARYQSDAIPLMEKAGQPTAMAIYRLRLYESHQPYHERDAAKSKYVGELKSLPSLPSVPEAPDGATE